MSGKNDFRGYLQLTFNMNGFLILNIPNMKHGIILIKLDLFYNKSKNKKGRKQQRDLKWTKKNKAAKVDENKEEENWCNDFVFEYHVLHDNSQDPPMSSNINQHNKLNKTEFFGSRLKKLQRVVQIFTIFDDPNYQATTTSGSNVVQVAIRISGCNDNNEDTTSSGIGFQLSHVYWS